MRVARTERFDDEAERFSLRFTCEDCGHFDGARQQCRHGWPTGPHRREHYLRPLRTGDDVVFCKEFEVR
jgi:hypothetical protein